MTPRITNRITEYQQRRAQALDLMEHEHDKVIEHRLKTRHGHVGTGYKAYLVRKSLTELAIREAERNTR